MSPIINLNKRKYDNKGKFIQQVNLDILYYSIIKANKLGPFKSKNAAYRAANKIYFETTNHKINTATIQSYAVKLKWYINARNGRIPFNNEEFILAATKIHGSKFDYTKVNYKTKHDKIKIRCTICDFSFEIRAQSHLLGNDCKKCIYKRLPQNNILPIHVYENKCKKKHNNRYKYFQDFSGFKNKIQIQCTICNNKFYQYAGSHASGSGCPHCKMSKGEWKIFDYLTNHNIKFESEKTFPNLKRKCYLFVDFYLPDYNLAIEFDGPQHYQEFKNFCEKDDFIRLQESDRIKEKYFRNNQIKFIRITDINKINKYLDFTIFNILPEDGI